MTSAEARRVWKFLRWRQKEVPSDTRLLLTSRVNDETALSPLMDDFASTAALIEQLDFVMTIDTDLAHLAETLSKPTWLLLSAASD